MRRRFPPLALPFTLVLAGGCVGTVGDSGAGNSPGSSTMDPAGGNNPSGNNPPGTGNGSPATIPTTPGNAGACSESAPAVTAARRLTREQYSATVRDLLGAGAMTAGDRLPSDDVSDGLFVAPETLIVTPTWASNAMAAAETLAKGAIANLGALVPCPATEGEACAKKFISSFGKRAYRRPLESAEVDGLLAVWKAGAATSFEHGIELCVQAMLQAPSFLYRLELGQKTGTVAGALKLTPYEVASRLSYGLWGSMPDETLMKAADAGELGTPAEVAKQARRMIDDDRARRTIVEFTARWFGLDHLDEVMKDPAVYPEFDEKLLASLKGGPKAFVDALLRAPAGEARLEALLSASYGMVDAATAPLYGVSAPGGSGFGKVELPTGKRFGLLTDVGVLTAHTFADASAPIHRGKFIRERLLCQDPPNPPADLNVEPPDPKPGIATRERLKEHTDVPACKGCHEFMDPLGFAYGNYDGLGRWRDKDQGQAIDVTGYVISSDFDGPYKNLADLSHKLAGSAQVSDCVAGTFLRFASGIESTIDDCARSKLRAAYSAAKGDLRELIVGITTTDAFQYRRTIAGEVLP